MIVLHGALNNGMSPKKKHTQEQQLQRDAKLKFKME